MHVRARSCLLPLLSTLQEEEEVTKVMLPSSAAVFMSCLQKKNKKKSLFNKTGENVFTPENQIF